ncbi:MAG: AEC family transporter [Campylobacterota bacterium]|nr:AEC family transporter [Campylobacterota bacterium]
MASIYGFILLGYIAKHIFKDQLDQKSFILLSLYFLQPILTFWGLTRTPINSDLVQTPFYYFIIITITLALLLLVAKFAVKDSKQRSIFIAASLIGNTGNLGIPLGIALFGEASVAYTSIINIANVFFIYTTGIYFFAKDKFNLIQSLQSMFKIPILWFAIAAIIFNIFEIPIHDNIDKVLQMGAYATIVIQLIIFGMYLHEIKLKTINYALGIKVSIAKHLLLPTVGLAIIVNTNLDAMVASILIIQLMVPLAVNTVNIAALYDCKPHDMTASILISTIVFIFMIYFYLQIIQYFLGA